MKITLTEFVTMDGVCQGPGSPDEDTSDGFTRGGWLVPYIDATFVQRTSDWLDHADGLLQHPHRGHLASHDRAHRRPGPDCRTTQGSTRPGTSDPRQRPAG